jgi:hypothetical protein
MSVTMRSILPAVRDALLQDAALVAACTGGAISPASRAAEVRIYSYRLPTPPIVSSQVPSRLPATIVIRPAPGGMSEDLPVQGHARVELRAYHLDDKRAEDLYFLALNAIAGDAHYSAARDVWFQCAAPPFPVNDIELNADFLLARAMIPLHVVLS